MYNTFTNIRGSAVLFILAVVCIPNLFLLNLGRFADYYSSSSTFIIPQKTSSPNESTTLSSNDNNVVSDYSKDIPLNMDTNDILLKYNWFYRALNGDFNNVTNTSNIKGIHEVKQYIDEHSQETLMQEWKNCNEIFSNETSCEPLAQRKFVVAYYSCPMEAGNRILRFLNAYLLAFLSNRTILWDYYNTENCLLNDLPPGYFDESRCLSLDTIEACDEVLVRHDWMPSFSEWQPRLNLPRQGVLMEAENKTDTQRGWTKDYDAADTPRLFRISKLINGKFFHTMSSEHDRDPKVIRRELSDRVGQLYEHGFYAAVGIMFESIFTIHPSLEPKYVPPLPKASLYLHARHPLPWYNGSDIEGEKWCLDTLLSGYNKSCTIILMSDRNLTIQLLKDEIESTYGCQTLTANTSTIGPNVSDSNYTDNEHGMFRGKGYFQDWALARHARAAGIAYHKQARAVLRSSSYLIQSSIAFRRLFEFNSTEEMPFFDVCYSKERQRYTPQPLISREFYQ